MTATNWFDRLSLLFIALLLVGVLGGCQTTIAVSHKPLDVLAFKPAPEVKEITCGDISAMQDGCPAEKVGMHTITLFALPALPIKSNSLKTTKDAIADAAKHGLESANYSVTKRDHLAQTQKGIEVQGRVTKLHYWSYSWFWPLMFQGGRMHYVLEVVNKDGAVLWSKPMKKASFWPAFFGSFGFESNVRSDLTGIARKVQTSATSDAFQNALKGVPQTEK